MPSLPSILPCLCNGCSRGWCTPFNHLFSRPIIHQRGTAVEGYRRPVACLLAQPASTGVPSSCTASFNLFSSSRLVTCCGYPSHRQFQSTGAFPYPHEGVRGIGDLTIMHRFHRCLECLKNMDGYQTTAQNKGVSFMNLVSTIPVKSCNSYSLKMAQVKAVIRWITRTTNLSLRREEALALTCLIDVGPEGPVVTSYWNALSRNLQKQVLLQPWQRVSSNKSSGQNCLVYRFDNN